MCIRDSNVLDELAKTRTLNLAKFLHALGMERIGPEVATVISQHFISLENILGWIETGDDEELTVIDGIREKVAAIFREGITKRKSLIMELTELITVVDEAESSSGIFDGKSFCITGTLSRSRKEIALAIKSLGGKVVSSVSGNLDYLVAGESAGSKLEKAKNLEVNILDENDLEILMNGANNRPEVSTQKSTSSTGTLDDWL